jgi:hypothetical protein
MDDIYICMYVCVDEKRNSFLVAKSLGNMLDSNNTQMNELMINEFPFLLVRHTYARLYQHPTCNEWMDG